MNSRDAYYRIQKCKPPITKFKAENKNQMIPPGRSSGMKQQAAWKYKNKTIPDGGTSSHPLEF